MTKFRIGLDTKRSKIVAQKRPRQDFDMSGSILAILIEPIAPSFQKRLTRCFAGTRIPQHGTPTLKTSSLRGPGSWAAAVSGEAGRFKS